MNSVGIVVLAWNHYSFTQSCLEYLFKNTDTSKYPILVIDNGSTDETIPYLRSLEAAGKISVILNGRNIGIAPALNQGIKWCGSSDFCFVSNDIAVGHNWMEALREGVYKDDRIGGGSPYIGPESTYDINVDRGFRENYKWKYWPRLRRDPSPEQLKEMLNEIHFGNFDGFTESWAETRREIPPFYEWFSMVMYIKRSTIDKVGLFDEQFVPFCNEDWDYIVRMNAHKLFRVSVTGSYVWHWGMITDRREFNDDPSLMPADKVTAELFHKKWDLLEKSKPLKLGPVQPWLVSDKENNRPYHLWKLKEPDKYPEIPQGEHELWKSEPYFEGETWKR